ncbi:hypothetical protein TWF970_003122 [Orbilia oligospora]|uniref:Mid2 domain-containing protein n=1 Tax=Orbilia oligospora TaxID=2813651 RepID=A0A7C8RGI1_ORBOL|nr:hypothetical protein TWF970_003122 [Orbilia oligospora]
MRAAVFFIAATVFSAAWAVPPRQFDKQAENPDSTSNIATKNQDNPLHRRGTSVSALWYDVPSPTPTPPPKKNIPGAVGATIAAVFIVTIAVVIFLAHRGIWLRHLRTQQLLKIKSKTVLSFRPTSTTPEPIEYDEEMRQQRSGQIVQSYISMETVCISDQDSEVGVPVNRMSIHDQYFDQSPEHIIITRPPPAVHRHRVVVPEHLAFGNAPTLL